MPQSLSSVLIHLVFSTKNRESFISPAVEAELHRYMATIFRDHDSPSLIIDGTTDHVHMLFALGRTITIAEVVEEVKTGSSKWLKARARARRKAPSSGIFIGREDTVRFQLANRMWPS